MDGGMAQPIARSARYRSVTCRLAIRPRPKRRGPADRAPRPASLRQGIRGSRLGRRRPQAPLFERLDHVQLVAACEAPYQQSAVVAGEIRCRLGSCRRGRGMAPASPGPSAPAAPTGRGRWLRRCRSRRSRVPKSSRCRQYGFGFGFGRSRAAQVVSLASGVVRAIGHCFAQDLFESASVSRPAK